MDLEDREVEGSGPFSEYFEGGCDCGGGGVSGGGIGKDLVTDFDTVRKHGLKARGSIASLVVTVGLIIAVAFLIASLFVPDSISMKASGWAVFILFGASVLLDASGLREQWDKNILSDQ